MLEYSLSFSLFSPSVFLDFQFLRIQSRGVSSGLEEDPPMLGNLWPRALLEMKSRVPEAFHQEVTKFRTGASVPPGLSGGESAVSDTHVLLCM